MKRSTVKENKYLLVLVLAGFALTAVAYFAASIQIRQSTSAEEKQQEVNRSIEVAIDKLRQSELDFKSLAAQLKVRNDDFAFRAWGGADIFIVKHGDGTELNSRALMSGFAGTGQELEFGQLFGLLPSDLDFKMASEFERRRYLTEVSEIIRDEEVFHLAVLQSISLGEYAFGTEKFPVVVPTGAVLASSPASLFITFDNIRASRSPFSRGTHNNLIEINLEQENFNLALSSIGELSVRISKDNAEYFSSFLSRVTRTSSDSGQSELADRLRQTEFGGSEEVVRPAWLGLGWMIIRVKQGSGSLRLDPENKAQPRVVMRGDLEGLVLLNPETGEAMRAWDFRQNYTSANP